jgi:hypothetical protein
VGLGEAGERIGHLDVTDGDVEEMPGRTQGHVAQQAFTVASVAHTWCGGQSASAPQPTWTQNPPFTQTCAGGA